ncbi:hypothetical protein CHLNCDRAFT_49913 [Chlorella variabilis]|uniref:EF-hand domain-containing protein n=1 Tax=Chlorella variabilis TaxID=554065 RepID=E1Z4L4_CHLVA|nr:hypothetical protein CHLNCDRAFT_49913 [Chlorella variabilis]EFN59366.1 hypothetical protein CHLNCDRAFT_49913 [Chlorella variabilis]|eukprot:XP_005851468.1 hypothetical protein CHLNCDRAFT_49913 [Chlorella variabilis]
MFGLNGSAARSAGYPAAPALPRGLLLADDVGSGRGKPRALAAAHTHGVLRPGGAAKWAAAERRLSLAAVALGLAVFLLSWRYLYQFTEMGGMALGGVLVVSGAAGYVGGRRRSANIVNLQLVASLIGILLAFNMISETVRDVSVDCALAELYHRGRATEKSVAAVAQQEAMVAVFGRLNELEETLTTVQQGAAKHVELREEQQKLKNTDLAYIRSKMDMIKRRAEDLLSSVLQNPNITAETIGRLSEEEKAVLRQRMDLADKVMARIERHHANKDDEITFEEYQELLAALTDVTAAPGDSAESGELVQARIQLYNMKAALERSKADSYSTLLVGEAPKALQQMEARRREQRERWNAQFEKHLHQQEAQGADFLVNLPEHCVKETAGERLVVGSGLASILLQLAAAYVALSLTLRLPVKGE